jgi:hypothetical protein
MAEDKGTATRIVFTGGAEVTVGEDFEDVRDAIFFKTPVPDYVEFGGGRLRADRRESGAHRVHRARLGRDGTFLLTEFRVVVSRRRLVNKPA